MATPIGRRRPLGAASRDRSGIESGAACLVPHADVVRVGVARVRRPGGIGAELRHQVRHKYGQLAQIDIAAEGEGYEPWVNQTLTSVNDCVVRLAVIERELVDWHSHEHEDEFFLVLEGRLELEVEGRRPFLLGVHQGVTIPRGVVHRPRAHGRTVLLLVEPATVIPTGND